MATNPQTEQLRALGNAMQARRAELKMTLKEAVKKAEVAEATWSEIAMGRRKPFRKTMAAIEDALEWEHGSCQAILDGGLPTPRPSMLKSGGPEREMVLTDLSDPDQKLTIIVAGTRPLTEEDSQRIIRMAKEAAKMHKEMHRHSDDVSTGE